MDHAGVIQHRWNCNDAGDERAGEEISTHFPHSAAEKKCGKGWKRVSTSKSNANVRVRRVNSVWTYVSSESSGPAVQRVIGRTYVNNIKGEKCK